MLIYFKKIILFVACSCSNDHNKCFIRRKCNQNFRKKNQSLQIEIYLNTFHEWVIIDLLWLQVLSLSGAQVGKISKQGLGLSHETSNEADNFSINFSMNLDVQLKAIIIGACIFIVNFVCDLFILIYWSQFNIDSSLYFSLLGFHVFWAHEG